MTLPSINPNVAAEKARSEKPFSISSIAMSKPPSPKPIKLLTSVGCTWLTAYPASVHKLRNRILTTQSDMLLFCSRDLRLSDDAPQAFIINVAAEHLKVADN